MVELAKGIEAGSTEYGDRQKLEAGLASLGGTSPSAGAGGSSPGTTPLPATDDPLGALLSGSVSGGGGPPTDGLSVGPGMGAPAEDPMMTDKANRLRMVATNAESPMLRAAARAQLRVMVGE